MNHDVAAVKAEAAAVELLAQFDSMGSFPQAPVLNAFQRVYCLISRSIKVL
jgi:hypothetical protein